MAIELDKLEARYLKKFFATNIDWLKSSDFSKESSLQELINRYGDFLEEYKLNWNRNLLMLLVDLKQELTRIRISPPSIEEKSIRIIKNPERSLSSFSLMKWVDILYDEIPANYNNQPITNSDMDQISNMLAQRIQSHEKEKVKRLKLKNYYLKTTKN